MTSDLRLHLLELHERLRSWRKVRRLHYPTVPAGTLCSVAKGAPVPRRHRRALGQGQRRKQTELEKRIARMARETREALRL